MVVAALVGFSLAALAAIAVGKPFTLKVAKNAPVRDIMKKASTVKHESIAVTSKGWAVYTLSGETAHHLKCTSKMCLGFWPPVKVTSAKGLAAAPGIKGKLGVLHRKKFRQLTLNGHPLYRFSADKKKDAAGGNGIVGFGGTWHVVKASAAGGTGGGTGTGSTGTTTTTTSTGTSTWG